MRVSASPRGRLAMAALVLVALAAGFYAWQRNRVETLPPNIVSGNGRLEGTQIDYDTSLISKGFVVVNPKAKATCGCGTSFSLS